MKNLSFFGGVEVQARVADPGGVAMDPIPTLEKQPESDLVKFTSTYFEGF